MDRGVLKFVLLLVVKDYAVVLNKTDNGCFPTGAFEEGDQGVEDPILNIVCR